MEENEAYWWTHVTVVSPLYPNRGQTRELQRQLTAVCGLYNHLLFDGIADYILGEPPKTYHDMCKMITSLRRESPDQDGILVYTLRDAASRVSDAMSYFLKRVGASEVLNLPKAKSPSRYRSIAFDPHTFGFFKNRAKLSSKLQIKCRNRHVPKDGRPVEVRLCLDGRNRWMLHVTYEVPRRISNEIDLDNPAQPKGIDLGLMRIVTDSDGRYVLGIRLYSRERRQISNISRRMSEYEEASPEDSPKNNF